MADGWQERLGRAARSMHRAARGDGAAVAMLTDTLGQLALGAGNAEASTVLRYLAAVLLDGDNTAVGELSAIAEKRLADAGKARADTHVAAVARLLGREVRSKNELAVSLIEGIMVEQQRAPDLRDLVWSTWNDLAWAHEHLPVLDALDEEAQIEAAMRMVEREQKITRPWREMDAEALLVLCLRGMGVDAKEAHRFVDHGMTWAQKLRRAAP